MRLLLLLGASASIAACVQALSPQDLQSLRDAQQLTLMAYSASTPATPAGQFDRAAYCSIEAVLNRNDASVWDSNGAIVCKAAK
jgi:hypothetical protein